MDVYLAAPIAGDRAAIGNARTMAEAITDLGHTVLTEHVVAPDVLEREAGLTPREIFDRDMSWLRTSEMLIAEVSRPSLGVGMEIGLALEWGKPVHCFCQKGTRLSALVAGNAHPNLKLWEYDTEWELRDGVERALMRT